MKHLVRIASVSPRVHLGNVTKNCKELETVYRTYAEQVDVIVTPELSLTGYTCGDLFVNRHRQGRRRTVTIGGNDSRIWQKGRSTCCRCAI